MTVLASLVPGSERQRLHHFLHDAPWYAGALNARRLQLWQEHLPLRPDGGGVLIVDEIGWSNADNSCVLCEHTELTLSPKQRVRHRPVQGIGPLL